MRNSKCFWLHSWSAWVDKESGVKTYDDNGVRRVIGKVIVQERRCEQCNRAELRIAQAEL